MSDIEEDSSDEEVEQKERWKPIPNFENYEISSKGNVRIKNTRKPRKPYNGQIILVKNGTKRSFGIKKLVKELFPEAEELETWKPFPDFPSYEISEKGVVRNKDTGNILKIDKKGSLLLKKNGEKCKRSQSQIMRQVFPVVRETEIWKTVIGYDLYEVSSFGRVRNRETLRLLNLSKIRGYRRVVLVQGENRTTFGVHRLVAVAFIPNPNRKLEVNHKNGIKHDNTVENLEWTTRVENVNHAISTGLRNRDYQHRTQPLIRIDKTTGGITDMFESVSEASEITGIKRSSIVWACSQEGREWEYIEEPLYYLELFGKSVEGEEWKKFRDTPYMVSSHGRVMSISPPKLLEIQFDKDDAEDGTEGNKRPRIVLNGKAYLVYRMVAETFIPNPHSLPQVDHIDSDATNSNVSNLRWVSAKTNSRYANARAVVQRNLDGTVVKIWPCIKDLAEELKYDASSITKSCKGKLKHYKGFIWTYKEELPKDCGLDDPITTGRKYEPVLQIDRDTGEIIEEWKCMTDASKNFGCSVQNIYSCCEGKSKTAMGYMWRRKKDMPKDGSRPKPLNREDIGSSHKILQVDVKTGESVE